MAKNRRKKWRLYQFLVACGAVKSKSDAALLAHSGKITVNGAVMESLHFQIHPFKDEVQVKGKKIEMKENRRYFVLNKPYGVETTKQNMLRFIRNRVGAEELHSFAPVGRLDKNTTGLLILTNDGRIGKRILDPKTKRLKVYVAKVKGMVTPAQARSLRNGVVIDVDGARYKTLPAVVDVVRADARSSILTIEIYEGKKRQVRKMCEAVEHPVVMLKRVAIAKLRLSGLQDGAVKEYSKETMYKLLFE